MLQLGFGQTRADAELLAEVLGTFLDKVGFNVSTNRANALPLKLAAHGALLAVAHRVHQPNDFECDVSAQTASCQHHIPPEPVRNTTRPATKPAPEDRDVI